MHIMRAFSLLLFAVLTVSVAACVSPLDSVIPPGDEDPEVPVDEDPEEEAFRFLSSESMTLLG